MSAELEAANKLLHKLVTFTYANNTIKGELLAYDESCIVVAEAKPDDTEFFATRIYKLNDVSSLVEAKNNKRCSMLGCIKYYNYLKRAMHAKSHPDKSGNTDWTNAIKYLLNAMKYGGADDLVLTEYMETVEDFVNTVIDSKIDKIDESYKDKQNVYHDFKDFLEDKDNEYPLDALSFYKLKALLTKAWLLRLECYAGRVINKANAIVPQPDVKDLSKIGMEKLSLWCLTKRCEAHINIKSKTDIEERTKIITEHTSKLTELKNQYKECLGITSHTSSNDNNQHSDNDKAIRIIDEEIPKLEERISKYADEDKENGDNLKLYRTLLFGYEYRTPNVANPKTVESKLRVSANKAIYGYLSLYYYFDKLFTVIADDERSTHKLDLLIRLLKSCSSKVEAFKRINNPDADSVLKELQDKLKGEWGVLQSIDWGLELRDCPTPKIVSLCYNLSKLSLHKEVIVVAKKIIIDTNATSSMKVMAYLKMCHAYIDCGEMQGRNIEDVITKALEAVKEIKLTQKDKESYSNTWGCGPDEEINEVREKFISKYKPIDNLSANLTKLVNEYFYTINPTIDAQCSYRKQYIDIVKYLSSVLLPDSINQQTLGKELIDNLQKGAIQFLYIPDELKKILSTHNIDISAIEKTITKRTAKLKHKFVEEMTNALTSYKKHQSTNEYN